jgi:UDP-N-acetylglucosamine 2-epimerase (hydrolysing)
MPNPRKTILFLTGTRADFGKLKPLIAEVDRSSDFEARIFATGMHMLARYGSTIHEIRGAGFKNIFHYINQDGNNPAGMDLTLATTMHGLAHYVREFPPDLIVVHGDRVEALAGAIVGALNNVLVAHIEGGELSGTVDELIRHAITKLSHLHFVANAEARERLIQMGEVPGSTFIIGSPDIDVMLSNDLPGLTEVKKRYGIAFDRYAVFTYHPVTTELPRLRRNVDAVLSALEECGQNFVAIYPNNDAGAEVILAGLERLEGNPRFRLIPSMRFEYFLALLKDAVAVVGNSSAGIREAPVYGVPTVNIGSRQLNRFNGPSILNVPEDKQAILDVLADLPSRLSPSLHFGKGQSARLFMERVRNPLFWKTPRQKQFQDIQPVALPGLGAAMAGLSA